MSRFARQERFERWAMFYGLCFLVLTSIGLYAVWPPLVWLFLGGWSGWMANGSLTEAKNS